MKAHELEWVPGLAEGRAPGYRARCRAGSQGGTLVFDGYKTARHQNYRQRYDDGWFSKFIHHSFEIRLGTRQFREFPDF